MLNGNWIRRRIDDVLVPVVTSFLETIATLTSRVSTVEADIGTLETTVTSDMASLSTLVGTDIANLETTIAHTYAPITSPTFLVSANAPTPDSTDSSTNVATTAFVVGKIAAATTGVSSVLGSTGAITTSELSAGGVALLNSPVFTGTPTAPTPTLGDNTTKLSTTAFTTSTVSTAVNAAIPSAASSLLGSTTTAGSARVITLGSGLALTGSVLSVSYSYSLPVATTMVLGGVKPDGTTLTNVAGAISVTYGTTANTAAQGNDSRITGALSTSAAGLTYAPIISPSFTNNVTANQAFISSGLDTGGANLRFYSSPTGYGAMWRNDNTNAYLLLTNNGNPLGNANSFQPMTVNLSTGFVSIDVTGVGTQFGGAVTALQTLASAPVSGAAGITLNSLGGGGNEYTFYAGVGANAGTSGLFNNTTGQAIWQSDTANHLLLVTNPATSDNTLKVVSSSWVVSALATMAAAAGFSADFSSTGYIRFPSWFGGLMIQWGSVGITSGMSAGNAVTFPWAFTNAPIALFCIDNNAQSQWWRAAPVVHGYSGLTTTGYTGWASIWGGGGFSGTYSVTQGYIAVGY